MNREKIREIFLRNGFTIKDGQSDLKPYVYAAAAELLKAALSQQQSPAAVPDGWKMVPVERIQIALEAVQNAMLDAYSNAYQECCGRGQGQCCGYPDAAWSAEDQRIMDALSPAQRELSGLLAAAPAAPVAQEPVRELIGYACDRRGALIPDRCGECLCWPAYQDAPPAAEQPDTVPVPRELLFRHLEEIGEYAWDTFDELRALLGKESV